MNISNEAHGARHQEGSPTCGERHSAEKWAWVFSDLVIPSPARKVPVRLIRFQSSVPEDHVLIRDHGTDLDQVLGDEDAVVDLGEGNVFYSIDKAACNPCDSCASPAKLAFVIADRYEVVLRGDQSHASVLDLFGLDSTTLLYRDRESPDDEPLDRDSLVQFSEGPVLIAKESEHETAVRVTIDGESYPIERGTYTVPQIKAIPSPPIPPEDTLRQVISNQFVPLAAGARIEICGGEVFASNCPTGAAS